MPFSSRTLLEVAIPLLAVYILIGAPAFTVPATLRDTIRSLFDPADATRPNAITQQNLDWALETLAIPSDNLSTACPPPSHTAHVYSTDPLVLYLDAFLTPREISTLTALAEPHYAPSTIFRSSAAGEANDTTIRASDKAPLPRTAPLVACVEERARALQGWRADLFVEKLWAQRYRAGGHYAAHYDWASDGGARGGRASSFMVWLGDGYGGGGTNFPRLARRGGEWCGRIECGEGEEQGTTFLPRAGSAVYWENFRRSDGKGYEESLHSGLPVERGEKIGLNIWSWWQPGLGKAMEEERERRRLAPLEGEL